MTHQTSFDHLEEFGTERSSSEWREEEIAIVNSKESLIKNLLQYVVRAVLIGNELNRALDGADLREGVSTSSTNQMGLHSLKIAMVPEFPHERSPTLATM